MSFFIASFITFFTSPSFHNPDKYIAIPCPIHVDETSEFKDRNS